MSTTKATTKKTAATKVPAGVKNPSDRKPKAEEGVESFTGVVSGVEVTVPAAALNDFEFLDDLNELERGNPSRLPSLLKRLAGDQYRELLEKARDEDGRVTIEAGMKLVEELLEVVSPN